MRSRPVQDQLIKDFRKKINSREWDTRLPSLAQLTVNYSVNFKTLRRVIDRLTEEGLLEAKQGLGTFIRRHPSTTTKGKTRERILVCAPFTRHHFASSLIQNSVNLGIQRNLQVEVIGYDSQRPEQSLQPILAGYDRGIIFPHRDDITPALRKLLNKFATRGRLILLDQRISGGNFTTVAGDHRDAGNQAVNKMLELGFKRIAYFQSSNVGSYRYRKLGYLDRITKNSLFKFVKIIQPRRDWFDKTIKQMLNRKPTPDALIIDGANYTNLVFWAFQRNGIDVPESFPIMSFDPDSVARQLGIMAMVQPINKIVERCFDLLGEKNWKNTTETIKTEFIDYSKNTEEIK